MTAGNRHRGRVRPTLRLRLTLLNGVLLVATGAVLLAVVWQLHGGRTGAGGSGAGGGWGTLLPLGVLALLVVSAVGTAGAWVVTGRALRPLQRVTATSRQLRGENLDERIGYAGSDDEVRELADTFDAMLDRLAESFEAHKRFVANASHELRTPLAVMRTEVDVTMSDPDTDLEGYRRMGRVVREASERANQLVEALLVLARSEAQSGRRLVRKAPADLAGCAAAALSAMRADIDRMRLRVSEHLEPAPVVGDPSLLDRLAGNLVENAVRYNHLHGAIRVSTSVEDGHARLVVGNTGFEVDPADVPGLFEPFRRGGRERTGARGSGLGLSIVRAVAGAHGGEVVAHAREEGGLEVAVTLPAAAADPDGVPEAPAGAAGAPAGGAGAPAGAAGGSAQRPGEAGGQQLHLPRAGTGPA